MIFQKSENIKSVLMFSCESIKKNTSIDREIVETSALQILADAYQVTFDQNKLGRNEYVWGKILETMHQGLDEDCLRFFKENSSIDDVLTSALEEYFPKKKKAGDKSDSDEEDD